MNKNEETKKEEVKNEEVKNGTEEVKKDENIEKNSKSFLETISGIWNSRPVRFIRKATKWTLITGGALLGVAAAAKTGTEVALEEHDAKLIEDSPEDGTPEEIPGDYEEIPSDSENSEES